MEAAHEDLGSLILQEARLQLPLRQHQELPLTHYMSE
jgi:hypothetical protein